MSTGKEHARGLLPAAAATAAAAAAAAAATAATTTHWLPSHTGSRENLGCSGKEGADRPKEVLPR